MLSSQAAAEKSEAARQEAEMSKLMKDMAMDAKLKAAGKAEAPAGSKAGTGGGAASGGAASQGGAEEGP